MCRAYAADARLPSLFRPNIVLISHGTLTFDTMPINTMNTTMSIVRAYTGFPAACNARASCFEVRVAFRQICCGKKGCREASAAERLFLHPEEHGVRHRLTHSVP